MIMNIRDCKIMSTEMVLQRVDRALELFIGALIKLMVAFSIRIVCWHYAGAELVLVDLATVCMRTIRYDSIVLLCESEDSRCD